MTAPSLVYALLAVLAVCSGYAVGRLHQWYRMDADREDAYREGYDDAARSTFTMAARMVGPRGEKGPAATPVQPGFPAPAPADVPPMLPPPSSAPAGAGPGASGGGRASARRDASAFAATPFPAPLAFPPVSSSAGGGLVAGSAGGGLVAGSTERGLGAGPAGGGTGVGGARGGPGSGSASGGPGGSVHGPAVPGGSVGAGGSGLMPPSGAEPGDGAPTEGADSSADPASSRARPKSGRSTGKLPRRGRHLVPQELVRAVTYRLNPDRVARAKVPGALPPPNGEEAAAEPSDETGTEPTARPAVPKPRTS